MSRKNVRGGQETQWESERTMAAAEEDERLSAQAGDDTRCVCGAGSLVLQAFFEVEGGHLRDGPIELDSLTCPECGREYDAVQMHDGRIVRGELQGMVDLDESPDEE